jgi:hypothetical protein
MRSLQWLMYLWLSASCTIRAALPFVRQGTDKAAPYHCHKVTTVHTTHFAVYGLSSVVSQYGNDAVHDGITPKGIQFMITNKMRTTLREELGYMDVEIDEMDPQVCETHFYKCIAALPLAFA